MNLRLIIFLSIFTLMSSWEYFFPAYRHFRPFNPRWVHNLLLVVLNTLIAHFTFAGLGLTLGIWAQEHRLGLFNFINAPIFLEFLLCIALLDMGIYWQHRIFHRHPLLWRLHRVHHSDMGYDATTALRFHPLEILLSLLIKAGFVVLLGATPAALIAFETLLNASAIFNHSNIRLGKIEPLMRKGIVTPAMHRIHHSILPDEMHHNFGFFLSIWDFIFKSYRAESRQKMSPFLFGIEGFSRAQSTGLFALLKQPWKG